MQILRVIVHKMYEIISWKLEIWWKHNLNWGGLDSKYKMGMVIQFHMISCHGVREEVSIPNLESNS